MKKLTPIHPGDILSTEFLEPKGICHSRLARAIKVRPRRINEICLGKRGITPDTALRFGRYLGVAPHERPAVLCSWGIDEEGKKVLLAVSPGTKDGELPRIFPGHAAPRPRRSAARGDGRRARLDPDRRRVLSAQPRQRCLAHRMRNLGAKVPDHFWPEVRGRVKAAYEAPSLEMAKALREDFVRE
jgi:addiction module HigA family antidote